MTRFDEVLALLSSEAERTRSGMRNSSAVAWGESARMGGRDWSVFSRVTGLDDRGVEHPVILLRVEEAMEGRAPGPIIIQDLGGSANAAVIVALKAECRRLGWPCLVATPDDDPEVAAVAASYGQFLASRWILCQWGEGGLRDQGRDLQSSSNVTMPKQPGDPWTVSFRATPDSDPEGRGAIDLSVSSSGGGTAVIEVRGRSEGNTRWLAHLTDAFDDAGWPYEIRLIESAPGGG